ncbi:hypothetical protein AB0J37_40900, partial [Microbispora rosea]
MRSPLARFLVRRILTALLLAVGITLITFVLTNLVPGDPVAANLGQRVVEGVAPAAVVARLDVLTRLVGPVGLLTADD